MSLSHPLCPQCGGHMDLQDGPHGAFWAHCSYTMSADPNGQYTPATRETREARKAAHLAIETIYRRDGLTSEQQKAFRGVFTAWLARYLEIDPRACYVGLLDAEQCHRVLAAVAEAKEMERAAGLRWDRWAGSSVRDARSAGSGPSSG